MNRWLKKIKRRPEKFLIILIFSAMVVITISAMLDAYNNPPSSVEYYDGPVIGVNPYFIIALLSIGAIVFFLNFYYSWRERKEKDMWDWWNKVVK